MNRAGLTLLEVMIALVILSLVGAGVLEVIGGTMRTDERARVWAQAVEHAEDQMEQMKIDGFGDALGRTEPLAGGFSRSVHAQAFSNGTALVTVEVQLPAGGQYRLRRLFKSL